MALPGLPGAAGDENNPTPVEEEVEHTTDDPYVSAVEGVASGEPALTEATPQETPMEPVSAAVTTTSTGFGGLLQVIPIPIVPEVPSAKTGPVIKSTETAPKETKEAVSSEPTNPAAQPIEAEASKPPSGEAEASKPPSGEADASKPPSGEADTSKPPSVEAETSKSTATASTSGNPETTPKPRPRVLGGAIARPRPRRLPLGNGLRACDQIGVYVWICMYAHQNCMVVSVFLCLFCVCVVFVHRRPAKSRAKSPLRVIKSIFLANVMLCSFGAVPVTGGATVPSVLRSSKVSPLRGGAAHWPLHPALLPSNC